MDQSIRILHPQNEMRSQLSFLNSDDACDRFALNHSRLAVGAYICKECGLRVLAHHTDAVTDEDCERFVHFTSERGAASRIIEPGSAGAGSLYVGSYIACLPKTIDEKAIAAVVNCCDIETIRRTDFQAWATTVRSLEAPPKSIRILRLGWADTISQQLWRAEKWDQLVEAVRFIHSERKGGANVLVHCMAGISRSGTVATAYVMAAEGLAFEAALSRVQMRRPLVQPNSSFIKQLREFERSRELKMLREELARA
jgi:protein-tyrosine phosphatase